MKRKNRAVKTVQELNQMANISDSLRTAASMFPGQIAVAAPSGSRRKRPLLYDTITFASLDQRADQIAAGIRLFGVEPGDRMCLMIPPGIEFVAWVFGVLRSGAIAVLIDPGMGKKNMIRCLAETNPAGIAGILLAQMARTWFQKRMPDARKNFLVGNGWWPGCIRANRFYRTRVPPFDSPTRSPEEPAAIIFTTGSTGPSKGVLYRHRNFIQQTIQIRDYFGIEPGGADVSGFPLFALFNTGMGMTTVFPRMDPTRPASVDPLDIADAVNRFQANQSFGSPALWNTVANFAEKKGLKLPTIARIITAGAPVPSHVLRRVRNMIPETATVHTPYGATESLPIACIESRTILQETAALTATGSGTCVGKRWPQIEWQVIEISDDPLPDVSGIRRVGQGEIGELMVAGPVVTDQYVTRVEANALHKVRDGDKIWHRTGDVGYLDRQDRFWFCGRKSHRLKTASGVMFTDPCEAIFNQHDSVFRSALVGTGPAGSQRPVIVVEPIAEAFPEDDSREDIFRRELLELGRANPLTRSIDTVLFSRELPTDIRHNSKIFREQIAVWAEKKLGK